MQSEKVSNEFLAIFDEVDASVYVVDPETYQILYVNKKIEESFGKNIVGKKCYKVFQNLNNPCSFCTNKYIFGKNLGKTYIWDFQNRRNGRWYHCIDRAIQWHDGKYVRFEIALDITDRKRFEERLSALHRFSQRLHMAKKEEEIYNLTLNAMKEALGFEYADFLISDGKVLTIVAQHGFPVSLGQKIPIYGKKGITARAARTGKSILIPDVNKDPTYIPTARGIRSELTVPIKIGKNVIGVLNVESKKQAAFDEKDMELLEILASHVAIAISRLRKQQKIEKRSKQLATLLKSSTEILRIRDLRSRLKFIAKAIKSLGWRKVIITVRDENFEVVDIVTVGLSKEDKKLLLSKMASGKVWLERIGSKFERFKIGEFFYLPWEDPWVRKQTKNWRVISSKLNSEESSEWHPRDLLYAPLRTPDGKLVGIISMSDPIDGKKPTKESLAPIEIFLNLAAVAIENARLIEEIEKARKVLKDYAEKLELKVEERTRELRESQEKLLRAERLAALGKLAGQVGHDLRNPLTGIMGAIYYLKKKMCPELDEKCKKMLEIIEKDVEYANKIITDLLEFSREYRHLQLISTTIRSLVEDALATVRIPENVKVINRTSHKHKVIVDADYMKRVFINLITNAFDAMPSGGILKIWSRKSNGYIKVFFKDTGVGIPKENLDKIWGALFTTKARGMGLGLSICKRIVEAHGGVITVKSKVGVGTTFTVMIPLKPVLKEEGGEKVWVSPPESLLSTTTKA